MKFRITSALAMIGLLFCVGAQAKAPAPNIIVIPPVLKDIEDKYTEAKTLEADFTQTELVVSLQVTKKSSGLLYIQRPDRVRWETKSPLENLFVAEGQVLKFYTPPFDEKDPSDKGQLILKKSSGIYSKLAMSILSGSFSLAKQMKIEKISEQEFSLKPSKKFNTDRISEIKLKIDPDKLLITHLFIQHRSGNKTDIDLTGIKLGRPLSPTLFQFTPPPGTEVRKE